PPGSALFPYTTLFRSTGAASSGQWYEVLRAATSAAAPKRERELAANEREQIFVDDVCVSRAHAVRQAGINLQRTVLHQFRGEHRDRKSTRLNSSHVKI